jgi:hypothetical protein
MSRLLIGGRLCGKKQSRTEYFTRQILDCGSTGNCVRSKVQAAVYAEGYNRAHECPLYLLALPYVQKGTCCAFSALVLGLR